MSAAVVTPIAFGAQGRSRQDHPSAQHISSRHDSRESCPTHDAEPQHSSACPLPIQCVSPQPTAVRTRLRLTRRGRVVIGSIISLPLVAIALLLMLNGGMATATTETPRVPFEYVTVHAGESLWSLVQSIAPSADPRDVVTEFVTLNQLPSASIQAGQRLAIPTKYAH